jgi:hypothetical protein
MLWCDLFIHVYISMDQLRHLGYLCTFHVKGTFNIVSSSYSELYDTILLAIISLCIIEHENLSYLTVTLNLMTR